MIPSSFAVLFKYGVESFCELGEVRFVDPNCDYIADLAGAINSMYQCKLYQHW